MQTPLLSPICASYPDHLILALITQIIFGEEYSYTSSSWYCFPHCPVTTCNKNVCILMNLFICSDKKYYSEVWCIIGSTVNFLHQNNDISSISLNLTIMLLGQRHESKIIYEGESIIIRTVCFIFIKTRAEILQLHNFSTQSPCFTMHFVHHRTVCFMTSE